MIMINVSNQSQSYLIRIRMLEERISPKCINTSYLTDSYIVFALKMESASKTTIFGLKMTVKSGLGKIFWKFLHVLIVLFLLLNLYF